MKYRARNFTLIGLVSILVAGSIAGFCSMRFVRRYYSLANAVNRLENKQCGLGDGMPPMNPRRFYGILDGETKDHYYCVYGEDDSGCLLVYLAASNDEKQEHEHAFAACYLSAKGEEKWYFCDTNRMLRYLTLQTQAPRH
jgi:hypothetical protein